MMISTSSSSSTTTAVIAVIVPLLLTTTTTKSTSTTSRRRSRRQSRRRHRNYFLLLVLALFLIISAAAATAAFATFSSTTATTSTTRRITTTSTMQKARRRRSITTTTTRAAASFDDDYDDDNDDSYYSDWNSDGDENEVALPQVHQRSRQQQSQPQKQHSHFYSRKSLDDPSFGNDDPTIFTELCRAARISKPSRIQSLAWPKLLLSSSSHQPPPPPSPIIIADQTGSGKTLAYLIPLIRRVALTKSRETAAGAEPAGVGASSTPNTAHNAPQPKLLVLAPTAELADQTYRVCQKLTTIASSSSSKLKTMIVTSSGRYGSTNIHDQVRMFQRQRQKVDILVSTPGRLSTLLRTKKGSLLDLSQLQSIVLDEVDILMQQESSGDDNTFGSQLRTIGEACGNHLSNVQFVFCTATLPQSIIDTIKREFPTVQQIKGPGLHRVSPNIKINLVDVSVGNGKPTTGGGPSRTKGKTGNNSKGRNKIRSKANLDECFNLKAEQLLESLRKNSCCDRTLVFCNTVQSCRQVENMLSRNDRSSQLYRVCGSYHNAMTPQSRNANLEEFIVRNNNNNNNNEYGSTGNDAANNNNKILICTDRAARGVDFETSPVDHVVVFDFPKDPAEVSFIFYCIIVL